MSPELGEASPAHEPKIWSPDYTAIGDAVGPIIEYCRAGGGEIDLRPAASGVRDNLLEPPEPTSSRAAVEESRGMLEDSAEAYVRDFTADTTARLSTNYPDSLQDEGSEPLETPNRYIKRRGLDGSFRPVLRTAQTETLQASKKRLSGTIHREISSDQYDLDIDEDALGADVEEYVINTQAELNDCVEKLKALLPMEDCREYLPARLAARIEAIKAEEDYTIATDLQTGRVKHIFKTPSKKESIEIQNALADLKRILDSIKSLPSLSARHAADKSEKAILDNLGRRLDQDLRNLADEELQVLAGELEASYDRAAKNGSQYRAPVKEASDEQKGAKTKVNQPARKQPGAEVSEPESESLGEIDNQFPWSDEENIEVSSFRTPDGTVLFCEAMSPVAKKISGRLRGQPRSSREFDQHWEKILTVEAGNNAREYGNIKKTTWAQSDKLAGHSVLQYGAVKPNAPRTYYIRTYAAKYPEIAELAGHMDIEPSTPLLILIAETDKANQLRTLGDFGVSRAIAKTGGAGQI